MKYIMSNQLYYSILLFVLSLAILPFLNIFTEDPFELETSVWCLKHLNESNICKFKNICYNPQFQTFLFFLTKESVIKGFNQYNELQKIQLSSVLHHNQFYANLSIIDIENYKLTKQIKIYPKALVFSRFKPNNIMHSLHDDIFPVFLTLEYACTGDLNCLENFDLIFHDNHPQGPFFNLYKLFSKNPPVLLGEQRDPGFMLCFKEMVTGLVINGVVYQYGFKKPHGPVNPSQLTQNDISRFTSFLKKKLQISPGVVKPYNVLLFSRQKNRKILNVNETKQMIEFAFKKLNKKVSVNLINLDLYSNELPTLIKLVSEADGLVGIHGAELILSLFLKPGSFVIEIFPFGIKPEVVSFIKPISQLDGSNFVYFSWRNMLKNNSVAHPDAHPAFGGISHLDEVTQTKIKNSTEVPAVQCCNNPLFLYHMYQDTFISSQFTNFLYESLVKTHKQQRETGEIIKKWFYPYKVYNVSCNFKLETGILSISWEPPFNAAKSKLKYSLYVKDQKGLLRKEVSTDKTMLNVEVPTRGSNNFEIWISVFLTSNNFKGPDLYINCN